MTILILAAAVFLGIHLLIAGTRVRDGIVGAVGENAYLALFSLLSIGVIVWLVISYNAAQASGDDPILYVTGVEVRHLGMPIVLLAFLIGVPGLMMANPTAVRMSETATK